jgi:stage III sporulation protein AF
VVVAVEVVKELVRTVVLIVLLAAVLEMLLPQENLGRFVRLVMGLFVVAAVLTSVSKILPRTVPATLLLPWGGAVVETEKIRRQAQALERYQQQVVQELVSEEVRRQVAALLGVEELEVQRAEVVADDERKVKELKVEVRLGEGREESLAEARERIARFYGVPPERVTVSLAR